MYNKTSKLSRLSCFGCSRDGDIRFIGQDGREQPNFVEYMDTLDTMDSKDGNFYIARFEVQVLGKEQH